MITRLKGIMNEILEEAGREMVSEITNDTLLRDNLGFNSFLLAELTVKIEDEYGVDIFENGIVTNVGEILVLLKEALK